MKDFIVILREPDGRQDVHDPIEVKEHRVRMSAWFQQHIKSGNITGGSALTLKGVQIKGRNADVVNDIHQVGTEIVGGYLLLKAIDWDNAIEMMKSFPVYEFDGYAEIREFLQT
ncbi:hypothetical protein HDF24_05865 [Mucilaginibacter sp. X4EP1]|uniref:hypothetical protein n=1 Tax=Mucilaginibacter sp. X4EP1 TaxID=2723092 RepID=UPI0021695BC9|nr:hypothetical protein [Mucilaginibacter sp. X4EP1]MCS3814377.1 hypothetical protein [Mucilaginibacter sp. X4EP1]